MKFLDKTKEKMVSTGLDIDFLKSHKKHEPYKENTDKVDLTKTANICPSKDTAQEIKTQATNHKGEKSFAKNIPDKRFVPRLFKTKNKKTSQNSIIKKQLKNEQKI